MRNDDIEVGSVVFDRDSGALLGRVVYGPFVMGDSGPDLVLVADDDNKISQLLVAEVTTDRPFQVGDEVVMSTRRTVPSVTIAAGPFRNEYGDVFYVATLPSGRHVTARASVLEPLPSTTLSRFITWRDCWYDTTAAYVDKDGDVWDFTGESRDRQPLMTARNLVGYSNYRLSEVVDKFGPLRKRES